VQGEVPGDLFPLGRTGLAVERAGDPPAGDGELQRARALRAQAPLVDRAVRVALDLQQLDLAAGQLLRVCEKRAPDGAVRADRVGYGRSLDAQALLDPGGFVELETKGRDA